MNFFWRTLTGACLQAKARIHLYEKASRKNIKPLKCTEQMCALYCSLLECEELGGLQASSAMLLFLYQVQTKNPSISFVRKNPKTLNIWAFPTCEVWTYEFQTNSAMLLLLYQAAVKQQSFVFFKISNIKNSRKPHNTEMCLLQRNSDQMVTGNPEVTQRMRRESRVPRKPGFQPGCLVAASPAPLLSEGVG